MIRFERMTRSARAVSLAAAVMGILSACGQKTDIGVADAAPVDLVAKVNGDGISAEQLNIALRVRRAATPSRCSTS
jgi:hypothetical protein